MSETIFQHYRTGTFTLTVTGFSAALEAQGRYVRDGHEVTVYLPLVTGTSNAATFTLVGLPAEALPTQDITQLCHVTDNGTAATGTLRLTADSDVITVGDGLAAGGFTTSGTKALNACALTYVSLPNG